METITKYLFGLSAAWLLSASANAALIVEGTDYADGPNPNIGAVGAGTTTISGNINGECAGPGLPFDCGFGAGPGADPVDRFTFDVAPGVAVTGIEFDILSGLTAPAGFTAEIDFDAAVFSDLAPGIYGISPVPPITDPVTLAIAGDQAALSGSYSLDWTVTVEAVAVPAPAPTVLLVLGTALIGLCSDRHSRQKGRARVCAAVA